MTKMALKARAGLFLAVASAAALLAGSAARAGEDRHVRIVNETDHVMVHFYASNTALNSWQEDILGDDVVKPGGDVNINIDDGSGHCKFDFQAVFDNGEKLVKHNIDVCEISSYRYTE
jgi:hypothetical protein